MAISSKDINTEIRELTELNHKTYCSSRYSRILKLRQLEREPVQYWRNPTKSELKFGEGAVHYLPIDRCDCETLQGNLKQWCKTGTLRYNLVK